MVMGKVNVDHHYVDVVFEKNSYNVKCSCRWKFSSAIRNVAMGQAYLHLAGMSAGINE